MDDRQCDVQPKKKVLEGCRILPWVVSYRDELREQSNPFASQYLDCDSCELSIHARRDWHCGFVPATEWSDETEYAKPPGFPFAADKQPDTCPGYLIQLPEVLEAATARFWKNSSQLSSRFGGLELPKVMLHLIEVISSEDAELRSYQLQRAKAKAGH